MADIDVFLEAIGSGDFDRELTSIVAAVKDRVRDAEVKVCWRVRVLDIEVTEQSQTMAEAMSVERQTGKKWGGYHPANSAVEAGAVVVAHLTEAQGLKGADALKRLAEVTAEQMANAVDEYQPKDEDAGTSGDS